MKSARMTMKYTVSKLRVFCCSYLKTSTSAAAAVAACVLVCGRIHTYLSAAAGSAARARAVALVMQQRLQQSCNRGCNRYISRHAGASRDFKAACRATCCELAGRAVRVHGCQPAGCQHVEHTLSRKVDCLCEVENRGASLTLTTFVNFEIFYQLSST
jgi:hypothetical protein